MSEINITSKQNISYGDKLNCTITNMLGSNELSSTSKLAKIIFENEDLPKDDKDAISYTLLKERKHFENFKSVSGKARNIVSDNEVVTDEPVNDDWLNRFNKIVEDVSDETMQNLWAQILAGEVKHPNSFSLRTLDVLRNMTRSDAQLFIDALKYLCFGEYILTGSEYGLPLMNVISLIEIGLMTPDELTHTRSIPIGNCVAPVNNRYLYSIENTNEQVIKVDFQVRRLTRAGVELLSLIDNKDYFETYDFIGKKFKSAGILKVELHKILIMDSNNKVTYSRNIEKTY